MYNAVTWLEVFFTMSAKKRFVFDPEPRAFKVHTRETPTFSPRLECCPNENTGLSQEDIDGRLWAKPFLFHFDHCKLVKLIPFGIYCVYCLSIGYTHQYVWKFCVQTFQFTKTKVWIDLACIYTQLWPCISKERSDGSWRRHLLDNESGLLIIPNLLLKTLLLYGHGLISLLKVWVVYPLSGLNTPDYFC